jgi:hypothetical protein
MTTLNRRAVVTGAAALVPAPALCKPVTHPDAELLDIGEQIKKRLPDYYKARQISHALYEHTKYATGPSLLGNLSASEKWERASNESGYSDAFERANELYVPIYELAKRASKVPLRTGARRAGARAAAIASGKASGGLQTFDSRWSKKLSHDPASHR